MEVVKMYLTKAGQSIALLKTLKSREMRKLPAKVLWDIRSFLKDEKITRLDGKFVINSFLPSFPGNAFNTLARAMVSLRQGRAVPVSAYVSLTNRCKYKCWHCSKAYRPAADLPLDTVIDTINNLQELGVSVIGFTGGEPLLRDDLELILGSLDDRSSSMIFTAGDGLTRERAHSLRLAGLFGVAVSLDHYKAEIHDKKRGKKGAYESALNAIRISRETGFYTIVQLVATRDVINPDSFDKYLELAGDLGVHEIRLLEPMPAGRLLNNDGNCFISEKERQELRELHIRTNKSSNLPKVCAFAHIEHCRMYGCGAGFQHLYIDAEGNVCPCDFVPVSFGNINDEPISDIWKRMNNAFGKPRPSCFLLKHASELWKAFNGRLPIPYERIKDSIEFEHKGDIPAYYKKLGTAVKA
jgi:MoaA/NifB/PqqE/SkfB family radical SAM enzyme